MFEWKVLTHYMGTELTTGFGHGIRYRPLDDWVNPLLEWANDPNPLKGIN